MKPFVTKRIKKLTRLKQKIGAITVLITNQKFGLTSFNNLTGETFMIDTYNPLSLIFLNFTTMSRLF